MGTYDNEILFIRGTFLNTKILDNCKNKEIELIYEITKDDLIEILPNNGGKLFVYYYWPRENAIYQYENVYNITVNIRNFKKVDIFVGINKILDNVLRENNFVTFETNVTNILNLISEQYKITKTEYTCYLKKDQDKPLLMLYTGFKKGNYSLAELIKE